MGFYCSRNKVNIDKLKINRKAAMAIVLAAFVGMLIVNRHIEGVLYGATPYGHAPLLSMGLRVLQLAAAVVTGMAVISLIKPLADRYNRIGRDTLFVYMYHSFVIIVVMRIATRIGVEPGILAAAIEFALVNLALLVMMRIKMFHYILNPLSNLLHIKK